MGAVGDFFDDIGVTGFIKEIGRVLGIYSHDETFSDIEISNLLTAGAAEKAGRNTAIRQSKGDSKKYHQDYKAFQRDYRKKYSAQFLTSLGYAPSTTATTRVFNETATFNYLSGIDTLADSMINFGARFMSNEEVAKKYMQDTYGSNWSNYSETLIDSGKNYNNFDVVPNAGNLDIELTRLPVETIEDNSLSNYNYDDVAFTIELNTGPDTMDLSGTAASGTIETVVEIRDSLSVLVESQVFDTSVTKAWSFTSQAHGNGTYEITVLEDTIQTSQYNEVINDVELYDIPNIFDIMVYDNLGVPSYKTVATKQLDGVTTVDIYTPVEYFNNTCSDYDNEVLYIEYYRTGSSPEWFIYYAAISSVPGSLYTGQNVDMTAIIALKENNTVVDLDDYKLKRMLSKLNLNPDQLVESLENPDMDNAYLMTAIHPMSNAPHANKAIFQSFEFYSPGSGDISITMSQLNMTYKFNLQRSDINGSIGDVGTYTKSVTPTHVVTSGSGESATETTVPASVTLRWQASETVYRELVITDFILTYKISGQTLSTYFDGESKYSRLVLPLDVLNGLLYKEFVSVYENSLCMLGFAVKTVRVKWYETGAFGAILKIVGFILAVWTGGLALAIVMAIVARFVIDFVLKILGPKIGGIFLVVLAVVMAFYGVSVGADAMQLWLQTASFALSTMNQAISMEMDSMIAKGQSEIEAIKDDNQEYIDRLENIRGDDSDGIITFMDSFNDTLTSYPPGFSDTPEYYISSMTGSIGLEVDHLFNIDRAIESRKIVDMSFY